MFFLYFNSFIKFAAKSTLILLLLGPSLIQAKELGAEWSWPGHALDSKYQNYEVHLAKFLRQETPNYLAYLGVSRWPTRTTLADFASIILQGTGHVEKQIAPGKWLIIGCRHPYCYEKIFLIIDQKSKKSVFVLLHSHLEHDAAPVTDAPIYHDPIMVMIATKHFACDQIPKRVTDELRSWMRKVGYKKVYKAHCLQKNRIKGKDHYGPIPFTFPYPALSNQP